MGREVEEATGNFQASLLQQQHLSIVNGLHHHHQHVESPIKRTGTLWTAVVHVIAGVIGSGILSLAWSMAQLGWIAGPISMLLFALVTLISATLHCDCYMSPDPETGPERHRSYYEAVNMTLGAKSSLVCVIIIFTSFFCTCVAYTITSAMSMRTIRKSYCYHHEGKEATCAYGEAPYILLFGAIQVILCQIPNFHKIQWLSTVAAIMSFTYSLISLGLGVDKVIANGVIKGSIAGVPTTPSIDKLWKVSQAVGDIAFAYPFTIILIEIQDTLKSPPPASQTMKKASATAVSITTIFYILCAAFGYAAFGDDTPGNLLTGFGSFEHLWLVDFANACVVIHLVAAYQIYCQPVFGVVDRWFYKKFPTSWIINSEYNLKVPFLPSLKFNLFRLCFRTIFVTATTSVATIFPYFNQVLGVKGALIFWPLIIYFPIEMYFKQKNVRKWSKQWVALRVFSFLCLLVALIAFTGSVEGLIASKFG